MFHELKKYSDYGKWSYIPGLKRHLTLGIILLTRPTPTPCNIFSFPVIIGRFIPRFIKLMGGSLPDFHPVLPCCTGHLAELPWLSPQGGNPGESWVCLLPHLQMEGDPVPVQHHLQQEDIETPEPFKIKWPVLHLFLHSVWALPLFHILNPKLPGPWPEAYFSTVTYYNWESTQNSQYIYLKPLSLRECFCNSLKRSFPFLWQLAFQYKS